jgi:Ras-related GTP-binding protein C/D
VLDLSSIYGTNDSKPGSSPTYTKDNNKAETYSVIKLSNGILYMRPVSASLALVCLIREDSYAKSGLIDYNFRCLCDSILEVFQ